MALAASTGAESLEGGIASHGTSTDAKARHLLVDNAGYADHVITMRTEGEDAGSADLWATGLYDGDAVVDTAYFRRTPTDYELAVVLSTKTGPVVLAELDSVTYMGVRALAPGRYPTACARGYGPKCSDGQAQHVDLNQDGIVLFRYESASRVFYLEDGSFVSEPLSD